MSGNPTSGRGRARRGGNTGRPSDERLGRGTGKGRFPISQVPISPPRVLGQSGRQPATTKESSGKRRKERGRNQVADGDKENREEERDVDEGEGERDGEREDEDYREERGDDFDMENPEWLGDEGDDEGALASHKRTRHEEDDDDVDEDEGGLEVQRKKRRKAALPKETPAWIHTPSASTKRAGDIPENAQLRFEESGNLKLLSQSVEIQAVVRRGINTSLIDTLFKSDLFAETEVVDHEVQETLINAALELGKKGKDTAVVYSIIASLLRHDPAYGNYLIPLVKSRLSGFRGLLKKTIIACVAGNYGLAMGCETKVAALLDCKTFVYGLLNDKPNYSRPFFHPCIIAALEALFQRHFPFSARNPQMFKSSVEGPNHQEPEIPVPLLASCLTLIRAILLEWKSGIHVPATFNAKEHISAYNSNITFLNELKAQNALGFHITMATLYQAATTNSAHAQADKEAQDAIAKLDVANLPTEIPSNPRAFVNATST